MRVGGGLPGVGQGPFLLTALRAKMSWMGRVEESPQAGGDSAHHIRFPQQEVPHSALRCPKHCPCLPCLPRHPFPLPQDGEQVNPAAT